MKKIKANLLILTVLTVGVLSAQNSGNKYKDLSPLQIASIKSKQMTLALDLDQEQQQAVEALWMERIKEQKAHSLTREERKSLTTEERLARREARLEKQIAMKRSMKTILTKAQYKRWEKMLVNKIKKQRIKKRRMVGRRP